MKRKVVVLSLLCFFSTLSFLQRVFPQHASLPPRGWNSYDSFIWVISEQEFLENAELVAQKLKSLGYEYVVVDYLWYRRNVKGASTNSLGFDVIDEWGRMVPDPDRWPSSKGGKGFAEVAARVHSLGLKFGIHVMKGISTQAFNANTPILDVTKGTVYEESGRQWHARDIGIKESPCPWMNNGFMSINTKSGAGKAFLRSLYLQYAEWGVDFVKHDCVFGDNLDLGEISYVSEVLNGLERPIVYSLSPGVKVTPNMAQSVLGLVNMYRITGDDWDSWNDVASHFDISRDFAAANMIGARGLLGNSWPDLDMLPLGWLSSPDTNNGPFRPSNLTPDEQKTQMTLWSMAKSPIMFGGDMRKLDDATYSIISNPTILEIDFFSSNNQEFPYIHATNALRIGDRGLTSQSRSLLSADTEGTDVFGLANCTDPRARGWSHRVVADDLEQVCWKGSTRMSRSVTPLCLYKRQPPLTLDGELIYKQHQRYRGKLHLTATEGAEVCLDGSPKRKLASQAFDRGSFSPCKSDANQMWELSHDGTLRNSYSGLCASADKANAVPEGVRAWIATGRKGEIYLAFFNLNPQKTLISANIPDVTKALRREKAATSCSCREAWSEQDLGQVKESVSMEVEKHGCALFVLNCN